VPPVVNVLVRELARLERFLAPASDGEAPAQAQVHRLRPGAAEEGAAEEGATEGGAEVGASLRAVAPAVPSFAAGRRR
jgi:hypothetical protein